MLSDDWPTSLEQLLRSDFPLPKQLRSLSHEPAVMRVMMSIPSWHLHSISLLTQVTQWQSKNFTSRSRMVQDMKIINARQKYIRRRKLDAGNSMIQQHKANEKQQKTY